MINYKFIYNFALVILFPFAVIYFTYISIKNNDLNFIKNRLGLVTKLNNQNNICVHCASLGEVNGATELIKEIGKNNSLLISTNTLSGMKRSKELFPELDIVYFPLDYDFIISKWLKLTKIKSVIIYETEIWLNFYKICHKMDIKLCIVNARLQKDLHKKIFISKIYVEALKYCDLVLCKSDYEKEKYMDLGTVESALITIGNLKYAYKPDTKLDKINIYVDSGNGDEKILNNYFLMASTHAPDELFHFDVILDLKRILGINTVIAPRHINRSKEIFEFFKQHGVEADLFSKLCKTEKKTMGKKDILIIDTFGDLSKFYSNAKYIYVGGGYSDRGVQNIIEPSFFGKPIIVGPNIDNFYEEITNLQAQNGIHVYLDWIIAQEAIMSWWEEFEKLSDNDLSKMGQEAKAQCLKYENIVKEYSEVLKDKGII